MAGGDGDTLVATRRRTYASAQISERRARILAAALDLIIETGSTGFTIQELSRRAGVAPRTLYYAFGGKEGVIESAVLEHFSDLARQHGLTPTPPYAPWVIKGLAASLAEILRVPNYARAMVDVYFSSSASQRIVAALRRNANGMSAIWLRAEIEADHVWAWVDPEAFLQQLSDLQYAALHTWCIGELSANEFAQRRRLNFLTLAQGILNEPGRRVFERVLSDELAIGFDGAAARRPSPDA
jgi:AcrR family transcriptional regulator